MKEKYKISLIVVMICLVITIIIGYTYALFVKNIETEQINKISTGCFDMEITEEKNKIELTNAYPITDEKANELKPYTFTITNTCSIFANYKVNIEVLEETTLDTSYVATKVNNEAKEILKERKTAEKVESSSKESREIINGALAPEDSVEYTLRVWMDEGVTLDDDAQGKIFKAKLVIISNPSSYSPYNEGITLLNNALLANEYQTTDIEAAKQRIISKGSPDTTKTAPIIEWQEKEGAKQTLTVTKPSCDEIGNYGVSSNNCKFFLAKEKKLNTSTGFFEHQNTAYYDILTLDFENENYYYGGTRFWWLPNGNISTSDNITQNFIYKIKGVTVKDSTSKNNNTGAVIKTKIYSIDVITYNTAHSESDKSDKGLYAVKDDFYNDLENNYSFIYRGNVSNNNVKFANTIWKIIRINGDGSIRLVNMKSEIKTSINTYFKDVSSIGYMHGNLNASSYDDAIKNSIDSNAKIKLDNWYVNNILNLNLVSFVADSGFCNDRTIYSGNGITTNTYFSSNKRCRDKNPTLICPNKERDLFTTSTATIGNKALTYPVGMLTLDELLYSGYNIDYVNDMNYLYVKDSFWTISPFRFNPSSTETWSYQQSSEGKVTIAYLDNIKYIFPVINLKSDTEITGGTGTSNDPFIIKTN